MTAGKKKSTDLYSFSFLMVAEAYEMRGSEMKTNGMKKQADKERVRER